MYNLYNEVIELKNKLIKEIKKNKYTSIAVLSFVILLILLFILYKAIMPSLGTPVYGNRLDGIEEVEITNEKINSLDEKVSTVNTVVTVIEGTKAATAKKITDVVLKEFDEDQVAYYDFQVFIKSENDKEDNYPIIAYKNKSNDKFSYSMSK